MSENVSREICLHELIKKSDLIIVAHKEDSSVFTEEHYIISYKKSPPFTSRYYIFTLSETIYTRAQIQTIPQKLNIYCADDTLHYQLYEKYIIDGSKNTVLTDYYQPDIAFEQTPELILFLKNEVRQGKFSFTVNGGYENISRIAEIKEILSSQ